MGGGPWVPLQFIHFFVPKTRSLLVGISLLLLLMTSPLQSLLLEGKRVLVTGGGRGIGRAIAIICREQGAKVAIVSRTVSELQETVLQCNIKEETEDFSLLTFQADVTSQEEVDSMVESIKTQWGGLDILINNVGASQQPKGPVDTLESRDLQSLLMLNCVSAHIVTSAVLKSGAMVGGSTGGRILNISSKAGKVGLPNYSFYVASKFALEGLTSSWAKELKERNIIVNSMSPGMVDTKSFPKPTGKEGVRSADSIKDCLLLALTSPKEFTGHYIHVDELDMVRNQGGGSVPDSAAWKPIDESSFRVMQSSPSTVTTEANDK